jgi:hypothetical protein
MESNHVIFATIILALTSIWWFLYHRKCHRTEVDLASARAAIKAILEKQQADLDSYLIRTKLHLSKLEQARQGHRQTNNSQLQLEATTNMVRAFYESIVFFQRKWNQQVEKLVKDYPIALTNPDETYLNQLLALPKALTDAESKLKAGLRLA